MELRVDIRINPHPDKISPQQMDQLLDGELVAFEKWFVNVQREKGNPNPSSLINVERAILKTYVMYLATKIEP